jgi:alpha-galactosidase
MRFQRSLLFLFVLAASGPCLGQTAIRYLAQPKAFVLDAGPVTYVLGINQRNEVEHVYWGDRLWRDADITGARVNPGWASFDLSPTATPDEYPAWGGGRFYEPALKVTRADGVRDVVLKYVSHEIKGDTLEILTKDMNDDIRVRLIYAAYPEGVIRRNAVITNGTKSPLTIESAQSAVWNLPPGDGYRLSYLQGRWAGETQLTREDIHPGLKVIESRRGNTGQVNPWFAIDGPERAAEESGRVWFGAIGWSGNWRITVEQTPHQQVRVVGGYNPFDFSWLLKASESLETPPFYAGYTKAGFGAASRMMHRFELAHVLPPASRGHVRPVLYNSWEATTFDVTEEGQRDLAKKAASLGVELFVMDDGWFGARNNDRAGLGDWYVNPKKFPNGLKPLIDSVKGLGMKFGLWVEPEMVNPDSDLYRAHPDWAMHFPGRPRTEARNQLVLNMARDDVRDHIFAELDKLLTENDIAFIKWDMNRHFSEPGWPEAPVAEQREIWVKYTRNVYDIIDRLRAKHPKVEIESCSGGGGRVDLGILTRVEQVWTSDNTDALDRSKIQEGFSQAYAPKVMMAWVTDVPNFNGRSTPLDFRFLVAMQGSLGIGNNLNHWKPEDFALATKMIAWYKGVRRTVQEGQLYRLRSPREGEWTYNQYVSGDGNQSVVFAIQRSQQYGRPAPAVVLRRLDAKATYRVKALDAKKLVETQPELGGAYLMGHGLNVLLTGDYSGTAVVLEKVE